MHIFSHPINPKNFSNTENNSNKIFLHCNLVIRNFWWYGNWCWKCKNFSDTNDILIEYKILNIKSCTDQNSLCTAIKDPISGVSKFSINCIENVETVVCIFVVDWIKHVVYRRCLYYCIVLEFSDVRASAERVSSE